MISAKKLRETSYKKHRSLARRLFETIDFLRAANTPNYLPFSRVRSHSRRLNSTLVASSKVWRSPSAHLHGCCRHLSFNLFRKLFRGSEFFRKNLQFGDFFGRGVSLCPRGEACDEPCGGYDENRLFSLTLTKPAKITKKSS